jgi:hypothetical protein
MTTPTTTMLSQRPAPVETDAHERRRAAHEQDRFTCNTLRLARLCRSAACRRGDRCRGHPRHCIDRLGDAVPPEAFEWVDVLLDARESGAAPADLAAGYPDAALAWRAWVAALAARVTRTPQDGRGRWRSDALAPHHHQRGPQKGPQYGR